MDGDAERNQVEKNRLSGAEVVCRRYTVYFEYSKKISRLSYVNSRGWAEFYNRFTLL